MKIHEYQGKQILARHGIPIPKGIPCFTAEEAEAAAKKLIDETKIPVCVVKAQIHAGGRGKGGGVKVVTGGPAEVKQVAAQILGMQLVTHQTGPEGQKVRRLYVEQGLDIARELYLGMVVDRESRRVAIMASTEGGVEIEKVAEETPEKILTEHVDPVIGLGGYQARKLAYGLEVGKGSPKAKETIKQFVDTVTKLARLFDQEDCSLCEINPLVITKSGDVVALDSKINFDDNASGRHAVWTELMDKDEEDPVEL
jgi:succinyl-CoA synthetase beta subunit